MSDLSLVAVSAISATFLLTPGDTRFALSRSLPWRIEDAHGRSLQSGLAEVAPLFVEGLDPDTDHVLITGIGEIRFRTAPCTAFLSAADHGVDPDRADNTAALDAAIAAVPNGGVLALPVGRIAFGSVRLRPQITVWLPEGCTLAAHGRQEGWPILPARDAEGRVLGTWEGLPERCFASPLTGVDCHGLTLTGRGTLDAGGDRGDWWSWPKGTREGARRPRALFLAHSDDVQITGLTICNAPSWTVHPYRCDRLVAAALTIRNPPDSPNTDGLNPECCIGARLVGLDFSVGDDCIAVKSGKRGQDGAEDHLSPTRELTIAHCRMARGHGAVVLGSEMSGDITDVHIRDCDFVGTDRGLRIKTRRGRGGQIARIRVERVRMTDVATPVALNAFYFCDPDGKSDAVQSRAPAPLDTGTPRLSDITLGDIVATGAISAGVAALGLPEAPITGVTLDRVEIAFAADAVAEVPLMALGVAPMAAVPLFAEHAQIAGRIQTHSDEPTEPAWT
ncbi:glycoside hydrolase family 28 protein [Salipiger sp. IMCC34102]|uniref:polygalacturonase PglA n=1 Tax=Salipiger sp. IMCC34102 TaxID=2510647 RepID=UPI00101DE48B|nr:glycoside hydrolase family 28 protein [Salipiger sp. IMCC34102]RYH03502.1 glycoside hydrolase family 28 protein [Salipiger sp. IMCC34102]